MNTTHILVAVIQEAHRIWRSGKYPSNFEGFSHATPRLEVLAFFHSEHFGEMAEMLDLDPWQWREMADIPQPTSTCPCESCRTDYRREAQIVVNLPRQHRFRFVVGAKHYVQWKHGDGSLGGEIVRIVPQLLPANPDELLTAAQYLAATAKSVPGAARPEPEKGDHRSNDKQRSKPVHEPVPPLPASLSHP